MEPLLIGGITDVQVVGTSEHSGGAVDEFTKDVSVAGMSLGVGDHVNHDVMQRDASISPPPHMSDGVQGQFVDGRVREVPGAPVAVHDFLPGLVGGRPELGGRPGVAGEALADRRTRTPEHLAEVPEGVWQCCA